MQSSTSEIDKKCYVEKLLNFIKGIVIDIELFEKNETFRRMQLLLKHSSNLNIKIFTLKLESIDIETLKLLENFNIKRKDFIKRPISMYERYMTIHRIFGMQNPNWLECRQILYLNYYSSSNPIHIPKEFNVFPSLNEATNFENIKPVICSLNLIRTCNIARNCLNNCIYCYVPHTGAPKMPLVVCLNMPEKVREQLQRTKPPYTATNFGSITDPANPLLDEVFGVFRETFLVLKERNYPTLVLTKSSPSLPLMNSLNFDKALLAFSLYHLNYKIKRKWELNAPPPMEILESMRRAKECGLRVALRIDVFPGYNDDLILLRKIILHAKKFGDIEHVVAGSFRGNLKILKQIRELNADGYYRLIDALNFKVKYSDNLLRPYKELRVKWYKRMFETCKKEGISFSLCKEEPDLVEEFTTEFLSGNIPKCLCNTI